jgi:hypothetical protein
VKRFNRTIHEEFIDCHGQLLITSNQFNRYPILLAPMVQRGKTPVGTEASITASVSVESKPPLRANHGGPIQ